MGAEETLLSLSSPSAHPKEPVDLPERQNPDQDFLFALYVLLWQRFGSINQAFQ